MKNKKHARIILIAALCLAIILPFIPFKTEASVDNFAAASAGFKGKKLSVLGDSISTYGGISNSTSYNSTIGGNAVYYSASNSYIASAEETWWMQTMDTLGMNLCVNNSWSGSCATDIGSGDGVAYKLNKRCVQLHNNTGTTAVNPDIIAVYLGTNDIKNITSASQLKKAGGGNYPMGATMNADGTAQVTFNYSTVTGKVSTEYTPTSILEAYALMVYRTLNKYQNAEVYCFTLLPNESQNQYNRDMYELYNAGIRAIVKYFNDSGKKIYLVDLYENSGIGQELELFDLYLANTLHPNAKGMDVITNCFLSSLVANSQYSLSEQCDVTYELNDSYVTAGPVTSATVGEMFSVSLLPTQSVYDLNVTVTMNGTDVTATAYSAGTVLIDKVTGPIHIKAEAVYETRNYRWELEDGGLKSCVPDGKDYHVSGEIDTKELVHKKGSYTNGSFSDTQYHLPVPIVLRNEESWVLEWKGSGQWSSNMLLTESSTDTSRNNSYLFFNSTTLLGFGFRKGYNNGQTGTDSAGNKVYEYPAGFTNFAASTSGLTLDSSTSHTYRLINKVSDDSNMVYLYVDGIEIGALDHYFAGNSNKNVQDNWISGKDFVFSYLGSESRPLKNCGIDYIQVWEGGSFDTQRLTQLQQEFDTLKASADKYVGFDAYQTAVNNSYAFSGTQEQCDALADAIVSARNQMTQTCDANTDSGEILSVELLTGDYARIGKQVGLRITTAPDVSDIRVDAQELSGVSAMLQTMKLYQNGAYQDVLVKVWVVTFDHGLTSAQTADYTVKAYLTDGSEGQEPFTKTVSFR